MCQNSVGPAGFRGLPPVVLARNDACHAGSRKGRSIRTSRAAAANRLPDRIVHAFRVSTEPRTRNVMPSFRISAQQLSRRSSMSMRRPPTIHVSRMPADSDRTSHRQRGVEECRRLDNHGDYRQQHELAIANVALAGCDPSDLDDQEPQEIINNSAVTGEIFRIVGPDALPGAADRVRELFWAHGIPAVKRDIAARYGRAFPDHP